MRKMLITGKNSYVGKSLEKLFGQYPERYSIDSISLRDESWKKTDFSRYDVVIHLAALVHKKEKPDMEGLYFKVNRDLPIEVAKKAKKAGVQQFIFMSTMAVYGEEGKIGQKVLIAKDTKPNPKTFYGKSKLQAECELQNLSSEFFKIVILRPPMIYGPNCPGNYTRLQSIAIKTPVFPLIENQRSMLSVGELCAYIKEYVDLKAEGVYFPQDEEYVTTSYLVKKIAEDNGKNIYMSKTLGWLIKVFGKRINLFNKVFGNLIYEKK
ncbi:UDP-glucose 4-epimerase [Evansella vedderi]|uniref:UDP-glucose 4-epimerase n=1 Tax=Evansella vedderi TaxID=38282 RepID=A0ABT9ZT91_9BACI|nr:NAD-dependent epimerase/dehydratase family protein [Evansella vedderi]MDQ0254462.1 UDP-glucose 4-epimerase [Evansella vedderi]